MSTSHVTTGESPDVAKGMLALAAGISMDVVANTFLRISRGFTQWLPSLLAIAGYGVAIYLYSVALRHIPMGIAYAMWSGLGTAALAIIGAIFWHEPLGFARIIGIVLIVIGVAIVAPRHA